MLFRTTWLAMLLAVAALGLHLSAGPGHACSCMQMTPDEAFERADSVFVGEVTSYRVRRGLFGWSSIDPTTVKFTVSEVWKGPQQDSLTIRTVRSEVSCGFEFKEGLTYLVYAQDGQTGLCDRTALSIRASEDLAALGSGWKPEPAVASRSDTPGPDGRGGCNALSTAGRNRTDLAVLASMAGLVALSAWRKRGL